jgi:hypothetical protein
MFSTRRLIPPVFCREWVHTQLREWADNQNKEVQPDVLSWRGKKLVQVTPAFQMNRLEINAVLLAKSIGKICGLSQWHKLERSADKKMTNIGFRAEDIKPISVSHKLAVLYNYFPISSQGKENQLNWIQLKEYRADIRQMVITPNPIQLKMLLPAISKNNEHYN